MKKKIFKTLTLGALACFASLSTTSCRKEVVYTYDRTYFNGVCALTGEFGNAVDSGLTNAWTAKNTKALGAKSFRLWISPCELFLVDENDELSLVQKYYSVMKEHIDMLVDAGVKNFLCMYTTFMYPIDYSPSTNYVVPDPVEEYDMYIRFLNLMGKASREMKKLFPMITVFEPANEPDFKVPPCIHKNGYVYGAAESVNIDYAYNDDDKTSIIADLCWYVKKYLKEVDPKAKVAIPGLTNQSSVPEFLDLIYKKIESKCLPAGQTFSDVNADNYFDVINWHPYPTANCFDPDNPDQIKWDVWYENNKKVYDVVINHGDEGKEVYFSELGWSDFGGYNYDNMNLIAGYYKEAFDCIIKKMPWVTVVFAFRMTNLLYQVVDATGGEENFGLFYHPDDPLHPGKPKPAAYAVAKIYNGEDYDLDEHLL